MGYSGSREMLAPKSKVGKNQEKGEKRLKQVGRRLKEK